MSETTLTRPEAELRSFRPRIDVREDENETVLLAEMPGVEESEVEVTLENRVLTIRATPRREEPRDLGLILAEYEPGAYERAFHVSEDVDPDGIEASMRNGLLRLRLPRLRPQTRRIEIRKG